MSRKARKKLGTDMPKNAKKRQRPIEIEPRRSATTMPIGIASAQVKTMLADRQDQRVEGARADQLEHRHPVRDRHAEVEVQDAPEPAAVAHRQRLAVAELHLHLADQVAARSTDSCAAR